MEGAENKSENGDVVANLPLALEVSEKEILPTIEAAERFVDRLVRFKQIALKATNNSDWAMMGPKPYCMDSGTKKIAQVFGIKFYDLETDMKKFVDEKNAESIIYTTNGKAEWLGRVIEEMGTGSTKDKFFGYKNDNWLPLSEIDIPNIQKKSVTNFYNRCVKRILGLDFTLEDLKTAGINPANNIIYKGGSKGGDTSTADEKKNQSQIMNWLLEMCGGNLGEAKKELKSLTGFIGKDKKEVSGVNDIKYLKDKRLDINYKKIKTVFEAWQKQYAKNEKDFDQATGAV